MIDVTTTHTSSLDTTDLRAIRRLLDEAFVDFDDDAWEHCLGGIHATIWEAGKVVAHARSSSGASCMRAGRCARDTSRRWPYARIGVDAATGAR